MDFTKRIKKALSQGNKYKYLVMYVAQGKQMGCYCEDEAELKKAKDKYKDNDPVVVKL